MKKLLLLGGLTAISSLSAFATIVNYSTTGSELCFGASGCGAANLTIGDVIVTFNPLAASSVNAEPTTFGSFGTIVVSCVGGGTACGPQNLAGYNLYLNITQTGPSAGSASLVGGALSGSVSGTGGLGLITWSVPNAVSIGNVTYSVLNNPLGLVPPSVNNGSTSVQAMITATEPPPPPSEVPEPSAYVMMSAALVGLGVIRKRTTK
jgi:hypothetical protein